MVCFVALAGCEDESGGVVGAPEPEVAPVEVPAPTAEEPGEVRPTPPELPSTAPEDGAPVLPTPAGGRAPVNPIVMALADDVAPSERRAEAERIAHAVEGELVSHLPSLALYVIRVPTETMEELGESIERVRADTAVRSATHNVVADLH